MNFVVGSLTVYQTSVRVERTSARLLSRQALPPAVSSKVPMPAVESLLPKELSDGTQREERREKGSCMKDLMSSAMPLLDGCQIRLGRLTDWDARCNIY